MFSHVGLSGPGIINLSNAISESISYNLLDDEDFEADFEIGLDLCPGFTRDQLNEKFTTDFHQFMHASYLEIFNRWNPSK